MQNTGYYMKVLRVIMQEQHRNPIVCKYISKSIKETEALIGQIIGILKELHTVRLDIEPDVWMKLTSSLFYAFENRYMLGIGDQSEGYSGMGMAGLMRALFDGLFEKHGV